MRSGWLAFLVSVILHGAVLGACCLLPGGRVEKSSAAFIEDGPGTSSDVATFLVDREQTDVMQIPSAPPTPVAPPPTPAEIKDTKPAAAIVPPAPVLPAGYTDKNNQASGAASGPASGSGLPRGIATTFFTVPARGQKIVYLIDGSASMGLHGALAAARAELLRSIQLLPDTVKFQIYVFNRPAFPLLPQLPGWLDPTPETLAAVAEALRNLPAEGGTDPRQALKYALSRQPAVLFFLTDAGEFQADAAREITRFNGGRSIINVVELSMGLTEGNDPALETLARENRGVVHLALLPR